MGAARPPQRNPQSRNKNSYASPREPIESADASFGWLHRARRRKRARPERQVAACNTCQRRHAAQPPANPKSSMLQERTNPCQEKSAHIRHSYTAMRVAVPNRGAVDAEDTAPFSPAAQLPCCGGRRGFRRFMEHEGATDGGARPGGSRLR